MINYMCNFAHKFEKIGGARGDSPEPNPRPSAWKTTALGTRPPWHFSSRSQVILIKVSFNMYKITCIIIRGTHNMHVKFQAHFQTFYLACFEPFTLGVTSNWTAPWNYKKLASDFPISSTSQLQRLLTVTIFDILGIITTFFKCIEQFALYK